MEHSLHRYDRGMLCWDYLRAAVGATICLAPLLAVEAGSVMVYILALLGVIFLIYGLRTLLRHGTTVEMSATGLRATGFWSQTLAWADLKGMKLAYYSTRRLRDKDRQGGKGWMELKLMGRRGNMTFDQSLDGFDSVVGAALQAAQAHDVALSEVTRANLDAMGFATSFGSLPDEHL